MFAMGLSSYLSFGEVELLCCLHSLSSVQVFVLVEDLFQLADLLWSKLCARTTLRSVFLQFASLVQVVTLRGSRFALVSGGIPADF